MQDTPGASFIPKRTTGTVAPVRRSRRVYLFSYIAYIFFFGTLIAVLGVFVLKTQAQNSKEDQIEMVANARQSFSIDQIDEVRQFDERLKIAQKILDAHKAPSRIFDQLESVILGPVRLLSFSYERDSETGPKLSFTGEADSFDVVLFQRNAMESNSLLASAKLVSVSYGAPLPSGFGQFRSEDGPSIEYAPTINFLFDKSLGQEDVLYEVGVAEPIFEEELPTEAASTTDTGGEDSVAEETDEPETSVSEETQE